MFERYYQQELGHLKDDLAVSFAKAHPTVASRLSGPSADPDVERLLEGVAFLTALLRQKLDDEFPEIIHEMIQLIWPHYLRPIPATTIVAFSPKPALKQPVTIPAGIQLASIPVEGTPCLFKTCYDIELHPLVLLEASFADTSDPPVITLLFELTSFALCDWRPRALRLFLAEDFVGATDLYLLLQNHLKGIVIKPIEDGQPVLLTPAHLKPGGFSRQETLIPFPDHSFPGYQILQEYFVLAEKFLFLDITGWELWQDRGKGNRFEIRFELTDLPFAPNRIRKDRFVLFATPAINIFPHDADPIRLDHRKTEYLIRPSGGEEVTSHYQVYEVDEVVGYTQGSAKARTYLPFSAFTPQMEPNPVYSTHIKTSPIGRGFEVYLSVAYPREAGPPDVETLSIGLQCTNGTMPEGLQVGDICVPTSSCPEFAEFRNIRVPTSNCLPPLGTSLLWRLLSHLALNYLSLGKPENLRALLDLYVFPQTRDLSLEQANKRRIAGLKDIRLKTADRFVDGIMMRGAEISLKAQQDHFAGPGDLFVFGSVMDSFFGSYASINTYTRLSIEETLSGDRYQWAARIGDHPLI